MVSIQLLWLFNEGTSRLEVNVRILGLFLLAHTFVIFTHSSETCAQELVNEIVESNFSTATKAMDGLIQLAEVDGQLEFFKNWDQKSRRKIAGKVTVAERRAMVAEYLERGFSAEVAETFTQEKMGFDDTWPGISDEFEKLRRATGARGSGRKTRQQKRRMDDGWRDRGFLGLRRDDPTNDQHAFFRSGPRN